MHPCARAKRVPPSDHETGSDGALTMTTTIRCHGAALAGMAAAMLAAPALAQDAPEYLTRQPIANGLGFQEYATDIMREIVWFNAYTMWFLVPIGIFVGGLLAYVVWKFNHNSHPVASRTAHNTTIEVVWTVAPVLVLLFLAVPSFQLLTAQFDPPEEPELTVKATGYQWYWGYEYQSNEDGSPILDFLQLPLLDDQDRDAAGKTDVALYPNLLAVDNEFIVPVGKVVRLLVTGGDVIHSWAMPSFGKKMDAIPGRLNETWFKVNEPGLYYGQCSELCGKDHAFMPIAVRVVTADQFARWYETATTASLDDANRALLTEIAGVAGAEAAVAADAVAGSPTDDTPGGDVVTDAEAPATAN